MANKKEFISNVTGEEWHKHHSKRWKKVIKQVGIILEDEVHKGKNGASVILEKGSRVMIDDIRGRIKPQYRVTDETGKVWFVSALNVEIEVNESHEPDVSSYSYRGGVRSDNSRLKNHRYSVEKTTEDELFTLKQERLKQKKQEKQ